MRPGGGILFSGRPFAAAGNFPAAAKPPDSGRARRRPSTVR